MRLNRGILLFVLILTACKLTKPVAISMSTEAPKPHAALPYYSLDSASGLNILMNSIGDAKIVLLGEASHGTSEFQEWRARISQRLIKEKGFAFVVMEADWNEMLSVNAFVNGQASDSVVSVLSSFTRWPTWMWSNYEFAEFATWVKKFNESKRATDKVRLFGFDLYGVGPSIDSLRNREHDQPAIQLLNEVDSCFKPYWDDALKYSTAVHNHSTNCSILMQELKQEKWNVLGKHLKNEGEFISTQHLATALNGEQYFRMLAQNVAAAWNIRDTHMMETIQRLIDAFGHDAKIIIWAHNSHIGDAAFTDMPQRGRTNLCELLRRKYPNGEIYSVGFGMYTGQAIAALKWGDSARIISLPPAYNTSWEAFLHDAGEGDKLILNREMQKIIPLNHWYDQRAIGVLYHPERPRSSYVPSYISRRYDAFIFIDSTHAMHLLSHQGLKPPKYISFLSPTLVGGNNKCALGL